MISNRPYLLRAFYQWIVDSKCTPILVIDANHPRCKIPQDYAEGGEIVFNVSPTAIRDMKMANDWVEFKASFSGVVHIIAAPIKAILAVYAEENGEGIFFDAEEDDETDSMVYLKEVDSPSADLPSIDALNGEQQHLSTSEPVSKSKPFLKLVE